MRNNAQRLVSAIQNIADFLWNAELLLRSASIAQSPLGVTWHPLDPSVDFLEIRGHVTPEQYLKWVNAGHYTCLLFDGSLLQMTYDFDGNAVIKHRLAYVPCPWKLEVELLDDGFSLEEVLELAPDTNVLMRSSVRFDLDIAALCRFHRHSTKPSIWSTAG